MMNIAAKCKILPAALSLLALSACGDGAAPEGEVSETVLGDIDVLEGSASDAMITVDEFDSGDSPTPAQSADDAAAAPASEGDAASNAANDSDAPATTIRPRNNAPAVDNSDDTADTGV